VAVTDLRPGRIGEGDAIPGIIEGSMTITPQPDGSLSLRVIIGTADENATECAQLELIIGSAHVADLGQVLDGFQAQRTDRTRSFPCHIGFCGNAVRTAPFR
jgi:hypothetical protein